VVVVMVKPLLPEDQGQQEIRVSFRYKGSPIESHNIDGHLFNVGSRVFVQASDTTIHNFTGDVERASERNLTDC
jgi:hypothetical protein